MAYSTTITDRIRELHAAYSFTQIADIINREFELDAPMTKDKAQKLAQKADDDQAVHDYLSGTWGDPLDRYLPPSRAADHRKLIVVADLHGCPDYKLGQMIIDEEPDGIIIGGDLLDSKQLSTHPYNPNDKAVTMQQEIHEDRRYVKRFSDELPRCWVEVLEGNHDYWAQKHVAKYIPTDVMFLIKNPLELITYDLPRVKLVATPLTARLPNSTPVDMGQTRYMALYGDALVSHADYTGKNPGDASKKLIAFVREYRRYLGWPELALVCQCHTHKVSIAEYEAGWLVAVEPGVGGDPSLDRYKLGYSQKWSPSPVGALVFTQDYDGAAWLTNRSSVRLLRPYR